MKSINALKMYFIIVLSVVLITGCAPKPTPGSTTKPDSETKPTINTDFPVIDIDGTDQESSLRDESLIFDLLQDADESMLTTNEQVSVSFDLSGADPVALFDVSGAVPIVMLPRLNYTKSRPIYVSVHVTAPADTLVNLFYKHPSQTGYTPALRKQLTLSKGENRANFTIRDPELTGRIRIDIGSEPGAYLVHGIKIGTRPPKQ